MNRKHVLKHVLKLSGQFQAAKMVKGTQQFHRLVPVSKSKLHAYKLSLQSDPLELVSVQNSEDDMIELLRSLPLKIKSKTMFVVCTTMWHGLG